MTVTIREAVAADAEVVQTIEALADALLVEALGAPEWPPPDDAAERIGGPGYVLLLEESAGASPVGFVHVLHADGTAHLEQLSVLPRTVAAATDAISSKPHWKRPAAADTHA